jgi:integrase/recombinase XerD
LRKPPTASSLRHSRTCASTPTRAASASACARSTHSSAASSKTTAAEWRDRALVGVLLGAGLRAAELVALDVSDVDEDTDGELVLHVRQGKGRRDRDVPVRRDVAKSLRAYLADTDRRLGASGPLFLSHDRARKGGGRLSARAVGYLVARLVEQAGVDAKRVSPHSLRHTFAIRSLKNGGNVVAVQKLLGHASIQTTTRYTDHLEVSELRSAIPDLPTA